MTLFLAFLPVVAQEPAGAPPPTITTARALLDLTPAQASTKIPCRIRGVVTCSAQRDLLLFVQDSTAGVYIYTPDVPPKSGSLVEVLGTTDKGQFSPIVVADSITSLGAAPLPEPLPVAVEQMAFGRHDSQWVEVEGVVMRQHIHWGHLVLTLASGSARLEVRILEFDPNQPVSWVDARVKIRGVAGTAYNNRRQLVAFHLLTPSTASITTLRPPNPDAFSLPIRPSTSLMSYSPAGGAEHRARLHGVVTWSWPSNGFFLRDASGDVRILSEQTDTLSPGDVVDVVGFPKPSFNRPVLQEALFRKTGQTNPPVARAASPREVSSGNAEGELVILEGVVLKTGERHRDHTALVLEADQHVFRVRHQDAWALPDASYLTGSRVRAVGICTHDSALSDESEGFSVWLRHASDLTVLERSPVWRQRQTKWFLGGLCGVILVGGAWLGLLRHRVRTQTEAIRKRETLLEERYLDLFENANDIIYTHDLEGVITSINNSGESVLGRPAKDLVGANIEAILIPEDIPKARAHTQSKLGGQSRTTYEIRAFSGTGQILVLEVNSRLLYRDGSPAGVQGIARDITDRKEAEDALRSSERQLRASLDERERLGHDLHDGIIQSLYAAGLNLDHCTRIVKPDPEAVESRLRSVTSELNRVIRDVRNFIARLEQEPLSGSGFKSALQSLALSVSGSPPAQVELKIDDRAAERLKSNQANHLLNVAREALSNSIRHGHARNVGFYLQCSGTGVRFVIDDDGTGFDPDAVDRRGRGLRNIAARADRLGADLTLDSRLNQGTRITLEIPEDPGHD